MTREMIDVDWDGDDEEVIDIFSLAADMLDPPDSAEWHPEPHQIPPDLPWFVWMLMGGRGCGKTATGSQYFYRHVMGPPCLPHVPGGHWPSIVAPTLGDAVTSCVNGPSGLKQYDPGLRVINAAGGMIARFSNGTEAKLFGASSPEDVERFRAGGNRCMVWAEEFAAWRYMEEAWGQIRYGLRVGPRPHAIITTTPRNRLLIKRMMADPNVAITKATTADNPHLDQSIKKMLYDDYAGTRIGRQELLGEFLEDVEGALWTPQMIENYRILEHEQPEWYDRLVIAVDPAMTNTEGSDTHGIVVMGMVNAGGYDRPGIMHVDKTHGFILEDASRKGNPTDWARRAVRAYQEHKADRIVAEVNNGGDLVVHTIHTLNNSIPVRKVWASRGKAKRAEPVSNLYAEGRIHHVGMFPELEDQMTGWDASDPDPAWSPDRMDALVWAATDLLVTERQVQMHSMKDTRLRGRR